MKIMKALVLSDTHIKYCEQLVELERILSPFLDEVDIIIHAGDLSSRLAVEFFEGLKPTYVVAGNMDNQELAMSLPDKKIIDFGAFKVGITHGWGKPAGIEDRVFTYFS
ncbi:MAG: metallophosphoesterase family protein, partial [Rubrobacteridae bacterium]|nr:metallophosphoesterase family protein [Rubrobacteridae bacterium]